MFKTKTMIRNIDNPITEVTEGKLVMKVAENTALEVVDDFKYLGAYIANWHVSFKQCRRLAWSQFWKLLTVKWVKTKQVSLSLKVHVWLPHPANNLLQHWNLDNNKSDEERYRFPWHKLLPIYVPRNKKNW